MLGTWRRHAEYQQFAVAALKVVRERNPKSIEDFKTSIIKLFILNLDSVMTDFAERFSVTGRPSNQQPEMFRAFILMVDLKIAAIGMFLKMARSNPILCALIGVTQGNLPGESTMRDFISRLWLEDAPERVKTVVKKPKGKHGKKKMPPENPGIIKELADKALAGETFGDIPEILLQTLFMKTAVIPSVDRGLIANPQSLTVSADGTCIESHASSNGIRIETDPAPENEAESSATAEGAIVNLIKAAVETTPEPELTTTESAAEIKPATVETPAETTPSEPSQVRRFADPQANWGWDSFHERYFYGHTGYFLSTHNPGLKLDLPLYLRFDTASAFDGVTLIKALAHALSTWKGVLGVENFLGDSAHDNYATYNLLKHWGIKPFIDLNNRGKDEPKPQKLVLSKRGIPICADGYEMTNWGFEAKKFRIKYRCPLVTGKVKYCPYAENCNKTRYGKIVYVRLAEDLRLLTPVPRGTDEWREIYKQRTAAERVNNRILTDYKLEQPKRYGKRKLAFFAFMNAINVHLDAQVKCGATTVDDLVA